ncbi:MAG: murein biosynthesis integral membrane protein MurJ [Planctomycetota bacterium]
MGDNPTVNDERHLEREHFFSAAKLVAAITMLSRVLGLVRDIAIVAFGANRATDSFWTAFRVPNVFRRLFGEGALAGAFVPVFTETAETQGWERARLVLANCAGLLAVLLATLVVIIELALACVLIFAPGEWDRTLLVQLIMIVLPFMITICLLALGSAALNCKGHFAYPAFAPILLNVFLIAGAYVAHRFLGGGEWEGLFALSISVVVAGVVQLAGVVWLLRSVDLRFIPRLRPIAPEVRRIAALTVPMMVPLGMTQISSLFDSFYAWFMTATPANPVLEIFGGSLTKPLAPGVVTCLYAAERLHNFPLGIFAISLATAVFPLFSRYAARGDLASLRDAINRALRLSLFVGIPAGVALILLARPIIVLIYRWGEFRPTDVARAALILQMYSLGMWAYFSRHILLRAFFARKDATTPMKISLALTAANILLVAVGIFTPLKGGAIGLAMTITSSVNVLLLTWILQRRWGELGIRSIGSSLAKFSSAAGGNSESAPLVHRSQRRCWRL